MEAYLEAERKCMNGLARSIERLMGDTVMSDFDLQTQALCLIALELHYTNENKRLDHDQAIKMGEQAMAKMATSYQPMHSGGGNVQTF